MTTVEQSVVDLAAAGWGMLGGADRRRGTWRVAIQRMRAVRGSPRRR